jgi:hypothetical protein
VIANTSLTPSLGQFQIKRTFPLAITGFLLGIVFFMAWSQGYFISWHRLPHPPQTPTTLVVAQEGILSIDTDASGPFTLWDNQWIPSNELGFPLEPEARSQECRLNWPQFSPIARPPFDLLLCTQTDYDLPDGYVATKLFALDGGGTLWVWNHAGLEFFTSYLCGVAFPLFGLMFGFAFAVVIWIVRMLGQRLAA